MFGTIRVYPFRDGTYDLEWAVKDKEGKDKACFNLSYNGTLTKFGFAPWKHSPWVRIDSWEVSRPTGARIRVRMNQKARFINY